ncbi:N/A [soil metagenome]
MRVLTGKTVKTMTREEFAAVAESFEAVDIDVGTGDGRFVLDRAARYPERLVIGLDPVAEAMANAANRITRRRTRQENVLFVLASVEQMPDELQRTAAHVFVNFPWGSLMRGLILGDDEILARLAGVGRSGATYRIILNLRIFDDPVPLDVQDLPEISVEYVNQHLVDPYLAAGLRITGARVLPARELSELPTTWSRRLSYRQPPPSLQIDAARK